MTGGDLYSQVMLLPAIVLITAALIFYTVGVWSEHLQRVLKWWHAGLFAVGLACDASGTLLMSKIASSGQGRSGGAGAGFNAVMAVMAVMAVTGAVALLLMVVHLAWAVVVLVRNREAEKTRFHKFSLVVWVIWLVPYFTGAIGANLG
ncbi:MAG: HsmA family protein [Specibacter sp.]